MPPTLWRWPCVMPPTKPPAGSWRSLRNVMKWPLVLLFASVAFAGDGPRLFYSRAFPGSTPAYFDITLESNGDVVYREAVDDDLPSKFHLAEADTKEVFALADKLD